MRFAKLVFYFWIRSIIFSGSLGRSIEKWLLERRGAHEDFCVDGYLDALSVLLERVKCVKGGRISEINFLEIGSGQTLILPIMLRMLGAKSVLSVDIVDLSVLPIIKDLVNKLRDSARFADMLQTLGSGGFPLKEDIDRCSSTKDLLAYFGVNYLPSCDLSCEDSFDLPFFRSVDVVYSNNVLEHIPPSVLRKIFESCRTQLSVGVLNVHLIDLADHFAIAVPALSKLNFLRYGEVKWALLAGNRYIYQNRLRYWDYAQIFGAVFSSVEIEVLKSLDPADYDLIRPEIDEAFLRGGAEKDLSALRILVVASETR